MALVREKKGIKLNANPSANILLKYSFIDIECKPVAVLISSALPESLAG